jgi:hypothetical protein
MTCLQHTDENMDRTPAGHANSPDKSPAYSDTGAASESRMSQLDRAVVMLWTERLRRHVGTLRFCALRSDTGTASMDPSLLCRASSSQPSRSPENDG